MASKRAYISPLREKAAAQTRALILRRATELFADRGYGRVTVADIAAAAGVASKTVFASVGSKADILDRIVEEGVAASGYEQAMEQVIAQRTPEAVLEALARGTRLGNEGQFTVHEAIRKALPCHEHGEALWERASADYRGALHAAARHLHTLAPPPRYTVDETADLLWYWFGPSGWRTLVVENGWSWDRAEEVLHRTAVATIY
ncbi:AcrR family transcriptional regulator [Streptacidiphilus sp. MAP12-16]|uniref:TetR/AcrR family transcriptional regulator n=1 Tax=Streptacidiphilus sp. MAP12-16 TaxID=3156300 RepID=UPI003513AFAC